MVEINIKVGLGALHGSLNAVGFGTPHGRE